MAYWHTELAATGPGVLLRDIRKPTPHVTLVASELAGLNADILVLGGIDYDHGWMALRSLRDAIGRAGGPAYPHLYSAPPNTGIDTGYDIDGDGRLSGARDAQGFGKFPGQKGMAVLSHWPIDLIADYTRWLWRDIPETLLIDAKGITGPAAQAADIQRLSSKVHWELRVAPPGMPAVTLMIFHASSPVFDGREDRNGRRNADEIRFWIHRLNGAFGPPPEPPFLIMGTFNLDPDHSDGLRGVMRDVLADPRIFDPPDLTGKPTANWPPPGPGKLRVDYILPAASTHLTASKVIATDPSASRHNPIVVEIDLAPVQAAEN